MSNTSYNVIVQWYDQYLQDNPLYREIVLPHLLEMLGDVSQQHICDLACGQGWLAREVARRGAHVTGVDLADSMLELARQYEAQEPLGITYIHDDLQSLQSLPDYSFDGVMCILALMVPPDLRAILQSCRRLLKPGGWFIFAITHPCFETPFSHWITLEDGSRYRAVNGYADERLWSSRGSGVRSLVGEYHRMLSTYLNTLVECGFAFERIAEPVASREQAARTSLSREVPTLLFIRARAV